MSDDGLAAFLNARLDEDEARAEAARRVQTGWYVACDDDTVTIGALREHIGHCSPARRLREAAAGRAILGRHKPLDDASGHLSCAWCSDDVDTASLDMRWPCPDVRDLAAIWKDHPDYRPEWKP